MNLYLRTWRIGFLSAFFAPVFAFMADSADRFRVDSLEFEIRNAFDDVRMHTPVDRQTYRLLNHLRFKTRQSVIRKHLLFDVGDTISTAEILESERILRNQLYIADAEIRRFSGIRGENIVRVITSDNWTTVVPVSLNKPGERWIWQVGLLENNFLGFGQSAGVYYGQDEERRSWLLRYGNGHFLVPHHRLEASYAQADDGYSGAFFLGMPFLSRQRSEWAYTIEGMAQKFDEWVYWSESDLPLPLRAFTASGDSIAYPVYEPGRRPNAIMRWNALRRDSLSLRLGRSGGGALRWQAKVSWDYQRQGYGNPSLSPRIFSDGAGGFYVLDTTWARRRFLPRKQDSRPGISWTWSRLRYAKLRNYHRIKWTEDVDRGWSWTIHLSKNSERCGAGDQNWFFAHSVSVQWGNDHHHLSLRAAQQGYWGWLDARPVEYVSRLGTEYMYKPDERLSSVWRFFLDDRRWGNESRLWSLGGLEGLYGLPSYLLVGNTRFWGAWEQRWFPDVEVGTMVPVLVAFLNAGQTAPDVRELMGRSPLWVAGIGLRVGMSKSVEGVINHINLAWPLNGPLADSPWPRLSILASVAL